LGRDGDKAPGAVLPIDLTANAASLGAEAVKVKTIPELRTALREAKQASTTVVIGIEVDRYEGVPAYESWWDVPVSEVSTVAAVKTAREGYDSSKKEERRYLEEV
jgi:3D-(3,5/4)-trihydroxycyclohexane-1,2-dione acylhydrolase (decyclizing)